MNLLKLPKNSHTFFKNLNILKNSKNAKQKVNVTKENTKKP